MGGFMKVHAALHAAFDIGNVLCRFDTTEFLQEMNRSIHTFGSYEFLEYLQKFQDVGLLTVRQQLIHQFVLSESDINRLISLWNETITPNDMMMNFIMNLKDEGVKIAYLSNMGPEHIEYLRNTYPEMFKDVVQHISCEVGARKPTKLFFQSFCLDHDEFSGCVYVDDIEENLKTGKQYGFKAYKFDLDQTLQQSTSQQKKTLDTLRSMILNRI